LLIYRIVYPAVNVVSANTVTASKAVLINYDAAAAKILFRLMLFALT